MNCRLQVVLRISYGYVVLHANKVYRNIKNRTDLFSGALPLVVAGSGTKKASIVISKYNYIVF